MYIPTHLKSLSYTIFVSLTLLGCVQPEPYQGEIMKEGEFEVTKSSPFVWSDHKISSSMKQIYQFTYTIRVTDGSPVTIETITGDNIEKDNLSKPVYFTESLTEQNPTMNCTLVGGAGSDEGEGFLIRMRVKSPEKSRVFIKIVRK